MPDDRAQTTDMPLDEWLREEEYRLRAFAAWWRSERAGSPEQFPDRMPAGEWDEQYRCWGGG
jgi:hypothetical protein